MATVGIVDYQAGNIRSICNALEHLGVRVVLVRSAEEARAVTHMLLPGVGAFGFCADQLRASGLIPFLEQWAIAERKPLLGICVGMQLLANSSEEAGLHEGLGWIPGQVKHLAQTLPGIRAPHVGWNNVRFEMPFGDIRASEELDFYFDHSYAFELADTDCALASCEHGNRFCAAVRKDNIIAAQFHPEKSQRAGMRFLRAFLET